MRRYLVLSFIAISGSLALCLLIAYSLLSSSQQPPATVSLKVANGDSLSKVAARLESNGVIKHALLIKLIARWQGNGNQIQVGTYSFHQAATPAEVLDRLVRGDVEKVSLTIPEGYTLRQIIERIAQEGFGRKDRLTKLSYDPEFIASLKIDADSLEGYLFPETYVFTPGIDEASLLKMLVDFFNAQMSPQLLQTAKKRNLDRHQLVTLASIIEKETAVIDEMPLISSVFHNRLKRRIPLQTDPTVIYGIKDFDGNITRKHLKTPTPYNTYIIRGLPPGPIASPGLKALQAAANPAQSKYLYFVSRGDGTHQFSRTLKEHNAAVRKYQLRRKR